MRNIMMSIVRVLGLAPIALTVALSLFAATPASAQDFQAYCNANFPNSQYQVQQTAYGPQHTCRRPGATGGFTLQNISAAEVCQAQTGSSANFRKGSVVQCGVDPDPTPTNPQTTEDYQRYCRDNFPNSIYERRQTAYGVRHFCRRPGPTGGYTLQDVTGAGGGGGAGGGNPPPFGGGNGGFGPRPNPPVFAPTAMHLDPCGDEVEGRNPRKVKHYWDEVRDDVRDKYKDARKKGKSAAEAEQYAARKAAEESIEEGGNRWDAALAAAAAVRYHNGTLAATGTAAYAAMRAHGGSESEATDAASWAVQHLAKVRPDWNVRDMVQPDRYCTRPYQEVQRNLDYRRAQAQADQNSAAAALVLGLALSNAYAYDHHDGYHHQDHGYNHHNQHHKKYH